MSIYEDKEKYRGVEEKPDSNGFYTKDGRRFHKPSNTDVTDKRMNLTAESQYNIDWMIYGSGPRSSSSSSSSTSSPESEERARKQKENLDKEAEEKAKKDLNVTLLSELKDMLTPEMLENFQKEVMKYCTTTTDYQFSGSQTPVSRRAIINAYSGITAQALGLFMTTLQYRGMGLERFSKKKDKSAENIAKMMSVLKIKGSPGGVHTVMAAKLAFSEYFVMMCAIVGKRDMFNGITYEGSCPVKYQFMGSLASMYDSLEETDPQKAREMYIAYYDNYAQWYIDVRAYEAEKRSKTNQSTDEEKATARSRNRSWYATSLSSFSIDCRRQWAQGNYRAPMTKGVQISDDSFDDLFTRMGEDVSKMKALKGTRVVPAERKQK